MDTDYLDFVLGCELRHQGTFANARFTRDAKRLAMLVIVEPILDLLEQPFAPNKAIF